MPILGPLVLGPPIVGIVLNWWLYGILTMQYFMYVNNGTRDKKSLRIIVHFLFLVDTIQTCMTMDDIFHWFVYHFGEDTMTRDINLAGINGPFMDATIAFTVQLVYCWRIWVLGRWRMLPVIIALCALGASATGVAVGIHDGILHTIEYPVDFILTDVWILLTAFTDILIAGSMTYLLLKFKSGRTSETTLSAIKRIMLLTVETNALTTIVAILFTISFLAPSIQPPHTNIFMSLGYILGKLYSNSFMVLLNQRLYHDTRRPKGDEGIRVETFTSISRSNHDTVPQRQATTWQDRNGGQVSVVRLETPELLHELPHQFHGSVKDRQDGYSFASEV